MQLNESDTLVLNCTADGIPRPTIIWSFRSASVDVGLRPRTSENKTIEVAFRSAITTVPGDRGYTSTLIITNVLNSADEGDYVCSADNGVGSRVRLGEPYQVFITRGWNSHFAFVNSCILF